MSGILGLNGSMGYSTSVGGSQGTSYGTSAQYGYQNSESVHNAYSSSIGENWSSDDSYSRTFGREASAQEIANAYTANQQQQEFIDQQMAYNAYEAEKNRQYQTYMSNTSYQRAVKDLLRAGLNPILAAGNMGASTPVGAQAVSGLASSAKANAHAEQYSESHGRSYGYNKSESRESSYSSSRGENWGSSYNSSQNSSYERSLSRTTNNIAEITKQGIGALNSVYTSGTGAMLYNNLKTKLTGKGSTQHKSSSGRIHGGRSGSY